MKVSTSPTALCWTLLETADDLLRCSPAAYVKSSAERGMSAADFARIPANLIETPRVDDGRVVALVDGVECSWPAGYRFPIPIYASLPREPC